MHNILDNYILNIPIFMIYKFPFEYQYCYQREVKLLTLTLRFMLNVVTTLKYRQLFNICLIYMHFLYYFNTLIWQVDIIIWKVDIIVRKDDFLVIMSTFQIMSNVDLSDNDIDLSDIKLTNRWQLDALAGYENKIFSY